MTPVVGTVTPSRKRGSGALVVERSTMVVVMKAVPSQVLCEIVQGLFPVQGPVPAGGWLPRRGFERLFPLSGRAVR